MKKIVQLQDGIDFSLYEKSVLYDYVSIKSLFNAPSLDFLRQHGSWLSNEGVKQEVFTWGL